MWGRGGVDPENVSGVEADHTNYNCRLRVHQHQNNERHTVRVRSHRTLRTWDNFRALADSWPGMCFYQSPVTISGVEADYVNMYVHQHQINERHNIWVSSHWPPRTWNTFCVVSDSWPSMCCHLSPDFLSWFGRGWVLLHSWTVHHTLIQSTTVTITRGSKYVILVVPKSAVRFIDVFPDLQVVVDDVCRWGQIV